MNHEPGRTFSWRSRLVKPFIEEQFDRKPDVEARKKSSLPWAAFLLLALSAFGLATSLFQFLRWRSSIAMASAGIWAVTLLTLLALQPRTFSIILSVLYLAVTACEGVLLAQTPAHHTLATGWSLVSIALSFISLFTLLNLHLRHPALPRNGISQPFTEPTAKLRSPEDDMTMWQWMTVAWMAPLISIGSRRQINDEDVWQLAYEFQHTHLHEAFRNLTGTVFVRLMKANWIDLVILTMSGLITLTANATSPLILQKLLQAMQSVDTDKKPAIVWAVVILVLELTAAQAGVFDTWFGRRAYERSRGEMITMLHEKVLHRKILGGKPKDESEKKESSCPANEARPEDTTVSSDVEPVTEQQAPEEAKKTKSSGFINATKALISKAAFCIPSRNKTSTETAKAASSMGKILNLMRNDVYEVAQRFWEFQSLINTPIGLVVALVLVWRMIGWPSLLGIAVVVFAQVVNAFLARVLLSWERIRRKATDHKLQQISQYIEAIRHLRWYGWQIRKLEAVMTARQKELNLRVVTFIWGNLIFFINLFSSGILPVATFWAYTALAGRTLSVDVAFPALQLFMLLQNNLRDIPNLITVLLNAAVAIGRIEEFMSEPDVATEGTAEEGEQLELRKASFAWPGNRNIVLHQLNLVFPPGLTIVIGPVASGKTALLQALLGELDLRDGQLIRPDAPVGYCAQTPWLESMTIRDNILFCTPYDEARYRHVLESCALLPDLASFPQGDLSPIGENGIGLSGGQKARVALARAVYSRSGILLLDDPLSALDQQTAEWIIARCLSGGLVSGRTVILVTHRTDLCRGLSEQVVELSNGQARSYKDEKIIANESTSLAKTSSSPEQTDPAQKSAAIREKFEDEEHRAHGGIKSSVYWEYVKAGKLRWWFVVILTVIIWRLLSYAQSWFLKEWGEAYNSVQQQLWLTVQTMATHPTSAGPARRFFDNLPDPGMNPYPWLFWFLIIVVAQSVIFLLSQIFMLVVTYTAGKAMFARIMVKISNATFRFYDVTPVGRLMNRLTGDVGTVDGPIAMLFLYVAWEGIAWVTSLLIIASVTPLFTVFALAVTALFVYYFVRFLPTSQSLRRLEMVSLSPLMSNFGALLTGLMTVRAFHMQIEFQNRVIKVTDAFQKMDHFYWSLQAWLQYRFQVLSASATLLLTLLAIYGKLPPGLTAFVLIAAQQFVGSTYRLCKQYGQLQLDFVSVERVVELLHLDQEDPGEKAPPAYWPALSSNHPAIEFDNVTVRYSPHNEPAIKNISFSIPAGSSTAIIGRTGSGKSTMALALLATIPPESGRIFIDGIDIAHVCKQDLRTRITFLAQDPVLFQGTLRTNLDPMSDYPDTDCTSVLHRIHGDTKYNWTLDTPVEAGGKNLSQGQRQLVGLARAMLRRSAIIIMDEATASVDLDTSWEIQRVLKEELAGSTVVTIAHRASAVRDCDLVVKLDKGSLVGFGPPDKVEVEVEVQVDAEATDGDVRAGSGFGSGSGNDADLQIF